MKTIPIKEVQIPPNRQRRNFDLKSLSELAESIKSFGLLHPIVLRSEGDQRFLVSGERRLRAITDIWELGDNYTHDNQLVPSFQIPYVDIGELDELAREEAELDENIRRADLTWQERAAGTARVAALRGKQAAREGLTPPPVALIAQEVRGSSEGVNQELTRREIIVAKHLADPEVKSAKSVGEAFKILRRKEDAQKRVVLAAQVGKSYSAETAHRLLNVDSLSWMQSWQEGVGEVPFDVICTDPIYGIGADTFGDSGGKANGAHFYDDSYETWKSHAGVLAREGFRITKAQAHLYAFCDITRFEEFKKILEEEGWNCFRTPIIWHKPNGSRTPWVDFGPQRKYELILYANKGRKPVTRIYPDLVSYPADENLGHQAQKPVALIQDLLLRSCAPGDRVLDPFAGSCPILPAAHRLKLRATALEQDQAAYGIGIQRMKQLSDAPELAGL